MKSRTTCWIKYQKLLLLVCMLLLGCYVFAANGNSAQYDEHTLSILWHHRSMIIGLALIATVVTVLIHRASPRK